MNFKTEQESFWEGKFGDDYINRNNEAIIVESNINFCAFILAKYGLPFFVNFVWMLAIFNC